MTTLKLKRDKDEGKEHYRRLISLIAEHYETDVSEPAALADFLTQRWQEQEREHDRYLDSLADQAQTLQQLYPDFDLTREMQNSLFAALVQAQVPLKTAYEAVHLEEMAALAADRAKDELQRQITEAIRIRGCRVPENGIYANCGRALGRDVARLSREQRADYARRAAKGEQITFTK